MSELAGLLKFEEVKSEIEKEKSLERWARRCSHHFTKKVKRMLFEEIDNMVWNGDEKEITSWCEMNKVYDEITENEIEEIWKREKSQTRKKRSDKTGNMSGRRPSGCVTSSTHTTTSSTSRRSVNTVL